MKVVYACLVSEQKMLTTAFFRKKRKGHFFTNFPRIRLHIHKSKHRSYNYMVNKNIKTIFGINNNNKQVTHPNTNPRPGQYLAHAHSHITRVVAAMAAVSALLGLISMA